MRREGEVFAGGEPGENHDHRRQQQHGKRRASTPWMGQGDAVRIAHTRPPATRDATT